MAQTQRIDLFAAFDDFIEDGRASNLTDGTLGFYRDKLPPFLTWLRTERSITHADQLAPAALRSFFVVLRERHSAGGVDAYWRAVSAFLGFLERDGALTANPLRKLRRPRVDTPLLPPIALDDIRALVRACQGATLNDRRDLAIIHLLLDTGMRAGELLNLDVGDVDLESGAVHVRRAKSRKARTVFLSPRTRRHVRAYLRKRGAGNAVAPLIQVHTDPPRRLTYDGLRSVIESRARKAGVPTPQIHAFRRTFAITSWRNGVDLLTIVRMMGQGSLPVLMRYIAAETGELSAIHDKHAPVNNL